MKLRFHMVFFFISRSFKHFTGVKHKIPRPYIEIVKHVMTRTFFLPWFNAMNHKQVVIYQKIN